MGVTLIRGFSLLASILVLASSISVLALAVVANNYVDRDFRYGATFDVNGTGRLMNLHPAHINRTEIYLTIAAGPIGIACALAALVLAATRWGPRNLSHPLHPAFLSTYALAVTFIISISAFAYATATRAAHASLESAPLTFPPQQQHRAGPHDNVLFRGYDGAAAYDAESWTCAVAAQRALSGGVAGDFARRCAVNRARRWLLLGDAACAVAAAAAVLVAAWRERRANPIEAYAKGL